MVSTEAAAGDERMATSPGPTVISSNPSCSRQLSFGMSVSCLGRQTNEPVPPNPLLEQFISESRDLLEASGKKLMQLEDAPDDQVILNELFRCVHTLKGNSGLFTFPEMTRVLHAGRRPAGDGKKRPSNLFPRVGGPLVGRNGLCGPALRRNRGY